MLFPTVTAKVVKKQLALLSTVSIACLLILCLPLNPGITGLSPIWGMTDTSTGWFQEADSKVINISCKNMLGNGALINMFKLCLNSTVQFNYFIYLTYFIHIFKIRFLYGWFVNGLKFIIIAIETVMS
jgi:hypothetical protein